jgi:hypothetical protein
VVAGVSEHHPTVAEVVRFTVVGHVPMDIAPLLSIDEVRGGFRLALCGTDGAPTVRFIPREVLEAVAYWRLRAVVRRYVDDAVVAYRRDDYDRAVAAEARRIWWP